MVACPGASAASESALVCRCGGRQSGDFAVHNRIPLFAD